MRDYISIGSSPANEDCVSVSKTEPYMGKMMAECRRFIEAIRKVVGPEPNGAMLGIKQFPHDFGTYAEVVCYFDTENEEATAYAMRCESEAPQNWPEGV